MERSRNSHPTTLIEAATRGDAVTVRRLLNAGIRERGALVAAITTGQYDIARILFGRGSNINERSDTGQSPLSTAISAGQPATFIMYLRRRGAQFDIEQPQDRTAIMTMVELHNYDVLKQFADDSIVQYIISNTPVSQTRDERWALAQLGFSSRHPASITPPPETPPVSPPPSYVTLPRLRSPAASPPPTYHKVRTSQAQRSGSVVLPPLAAAARRSPQPHQSRYSRERHERREQAEQHEQREQAERREHREQAEQAEQRVTLETARLRSRQLPHSQWGSLEWLFGRQGR